MVITIHEGSDNSNVLLSSNDDRFAEAWGSSVFIATSHAYLELKKIEQWSEGKFDESVVFELD